MKALSIIVVIAFILFVVATERWKWSECRKVGHGFLYCLNEQGK